MIPQGPLFHKPKSILAARNMLYATLFLGVINWAIAQWGTDLNNYSPVLGAVTLVTTLVVLLILIKQIALGRKWARVALLVLFVAGMLVYSWTLAALFKTNLLVGVLIIFQAALQVAALVFLFSKESTHWFNRVYSTEKDQPVSGS
jgi:hypothetical protein